MKKTQRLTVGAILVALAVVLSMVKVFELPFGGSITACSMVPVMLAGYLYGPKWGLLCGFADGVLQGLLGAATTQAFAGMVAGQAVAMACLDYLIAFSVLGLAGIFRKTIHKPTLSFALGCGVAAFLRFVTHTVSGALLYGSWAEWYFTQSGFYAWGATILERFSGTELSIVYSVIYNASYMIPETILSVVAAVLISRVKPIRKRMQID